jgi:predicted Zn-dependent peptidase
MKRYIVLLWVIILLMTGVGMIPAAAVEYPKIRYTTINGMKLILQRKDSPLTEVTLLLKSGSGIEPEGKSGIGLVMNSLVGIKLHASEEDFGEVDVNTYPEYTLINFKTSADDLKLVLKEVKVLLTTPLYSYDIINDVKELFSTDLKASSSLAKAYQKTGELFYGPKHPYTDRLYPETVRAIEGKEVYRWYRRTYQPGNAILSIAGGIDMNLSEIEKLFTPMISQKVNQHLLIQPVFPTENKRAEFVDPNGRITTMCMGFAAPRIQDPEYPAFRVLAYYLENYQYYFEELRVKQGLMYTGFAYYNYMERPKAPNIVLMTMTDRDSLAKVETKTVELIHDLMEKGIAQKDIDQMVKNIKAEAENGEMAGTGLAYRNALSEYLQTTALFEANLFPKLEKVTADDIKKAVAKYMKNYVRVAFIPDQLATNLYRE